MVVQHSIPYMTANRHYNDHIAQMTRAATRLSSGKKINSASDDPAGLAISQKMKAQIRGLEVAEKLTNDLLDFYRTADAVLSGMSDMLQRMNELAIQSANGTLTAQDRQSLNEEFKQLLEELDSMAESATYNGEKIFGGTALMSLRAKYDENIEDSGLEQIKLIQVGPNEGDVFIQELQDVSARKLGIHNNSIGTQDDAKDSIDSVKSAIQTVAVQRSIIGANIRRIEHKLEKMSVFADNLKEAESRITDADLAEEMVNYTKHKILADVGTAVMLHERLRQETVLFLMDFNYTHRSVI